MSASRIGASTKPELQAMLSLFGRGLENRTPKAQVVAAVNQLKADLCAGTVAVDGTPDDGMKTNEKRHSEAAKCIFHALREASLI